MGFNSPNHPARRPSSIWKLSPKHNGSNLLDSYELQAITRQLNHAIRASNSPSTPRSFHLKSPFYLHRLDRIYKQNSKTSKKISTSKKNGGVSESRTEAKGTRGFVLRLWNKVKCGLVRGKMPHS
ncbi:Avr9/Cf-9 rapidly elicited protein [Perilla frutescens var. frutescens]|nr:Avr9/Cf-9 rapidly elicited protein [Perilla frutescens var. frutescens]